MKVPKRFFILRRQKIVSFIEPFFSDLPKISEVLDLNPFLLINHKFPGNSI